MGLNLNDATTAYDLHGPSLDLNNVIPFRDDPLRDAALEHVGRGFSVFRCRIRDKKPATDNGCKDASGCHEDVFCDWLAHPHANIGIATGAPSGVWVLDIDGDEGEERLMDGNSTAVTTVLDWLAHIVQHPDKKIRWAPLIISPEEGVGKGLLCEAVKPIIGRRNVRTVSNEELASQFSDFLVGAGLIYIPEMLVPDHGDRRKVMTRMNTWVTDEEVSVVPKGLKGFTYPNRFNILAFSNHEDAVLLRSQDRRFFVHISRAKPLPDDYGPNFMDWLDRGGHEIVAHYLLTRDISAFKPNGRAPSSDSKLKVVENSRASWEAYLDDLLDAEEMPFGRDLVVVSHAVEWLNDKHNMKLTTKNVRSWLESKGAVDLGQKRTRWGKPVIWAIRNHAMWVAAKESEIVSAYFRPGYGWGDESKSGILD